MLRQPRQGALFVEAVAAERQTHHGISNIKLVGADDAPSLLPQHLGCNGTSGSTARTLFGQLADVVAVRPLYHHHQYFQEGAVVLRRRISFGVLIITILGTFFSV